MGDKPLLCFKRPYEVECCLRRQNPAVQTWPSWVFISLFALQAAATQLGYRVTGMQHRAGQQIKKPPNVHMFDTAKIRVYFLGLQQVACVTVLYLIEIVIIVGGIPFAFVVAKVVFCHFFFAANHLCCELPGLSFSVFLPMTAPKRYNSGKSLCRRSNPHPKV